MHEARKLLANNSDQSSAEPRLAISWQKVASYIAAGLAGLVIGYFAGREHIKYEIRTAFQSSAERLQQQLIGGYMTAITQPSQSAPVPPPKPAESPPLNITLVSKGFHNSN